MKRYFVLGVALIVAWGVMVGVVRAGNNPTPTPYVSCGPGGCGDPGSGSSCPYGGREYAGYSHAQPHIGNSAGAIIGDYYSQLYNGGMVAGWVGVSSSASDTHGPLRWLQLGLTVDSGGLAFYIETRNGDWSTHNFPVYSYTAQYSTQYQFSLYHNGSGSWTATISTYPGGQVLFNYPFNVAVDNLQYNGEAWNYNSSVCNVMEFAFWGTAWPLSQMTATDPVQNYPYFIDVGTHGNDFTAAGP